MTKLKWLALLIGLAMIIIAGFQVYWLRDNYRREKAALTTQTEILFRDMVRTIQDSTIQGRMKRLLRDSSGNTFVAARRDAAGRRGPNPGRFINVIRRTLRQDSLRARTRPASRVFFNMERAGQLNVDSLRTSGISGNLDTAISEVRVIRNPTLVRNQPRAAGRTARDSTRFNTTHSGILYIDNESGDRITIRIDSLFRDTLSIDTVRNAFQRTIAQSHPGVPFQISWLPPDTTAEQDFRRQEFDPEERYQMQLGNATAYLLRRITMPILFSIFLVGLTLFSFILLYRSLSRQQRLARLKNDFISNMTHELKTPIATVGVAIEALKDFNAMNNPEKTKEYLEISGLEVQRLSLLVDNVLRQSMFEASRMEVAKDLVDMEALTRDVINSLRLQLEKADATIHLDAKGELQLYADKFHLVSVMLNLIDNSLKYSTGKPVIDIQLTGTAESVRIEIADNGIGIPTQYRSKVFEKFFRVPSGNRHNTKGYGLGLSYVAQVVKEHHGSIDVESVPGSGSRFILHFPKKLPDA